MMDTPMRRIMARLSGRSIVLTLESVTLAVFAPKQTFDGTGTGNGIRIGIDGD